MSAVRVATWNVNSIRARVDGVAAWIDDFAPDVVLLQETRCSESDFPMFDFVGRGFEVVHHGGSHRNGVAIASRVGLDDIREGFRTEPPAEFAADFAEPRLVSAVCGDVRVHSVYVPNGREIGHHQYRFKLAWLDLLRQDVADDIAAGVPTLIGGDFNVAPADIDIYDPVRWRGETHASPAERAALGRLLDLGLHDVHRERHPEPRLYTWWNYRPGQFEKNNGLRIDLFLVSGDLSARTDEVFVSREGRSCARPSDHAPVVIDLQAV